MNFDGHLFFSGAAAPTPRIAPRRRTFAGHRPAAALSVLGGEVFIGWLLAQAGLDATAYRAQPLLRRVPALLRALRVETAGEARQRLEDAPELLSAALDIVLLGVTTFNRDREVFNLLRDHVLPELLARPGRLRIWSAAGSDGAEAYAVGMQRAELGGLARAELVGSDCRPGAIVRASAGVFAPEALASLAPGGASYFVPVGNRRVQVCAGLRGAVRWRIVNLLEKVLPGPWDIILCRNVAIYLQPETAAEVWRRLVRELRPGGFLITGKADNPPRELRLERVARCVYQLPQYDRA